MPLRAPASHILLDLKRCGRQTAPVTEGLLMRRTAQKRFAYLWTALFVLALLAAPLQTALAHGGEDHGDEKKEEVTSAGANMFARVTRVGDYEVTIKHPSVEPDKETTARIFVTRYATNEPVRNAKIMVTVDDASMGGPVEVAATATGTSGIYEVKLPPMTRGECKLSARIDVDGDSIVANYGAMQVAASPTEVNSGVALWARTALIILGSLFALSVLGGVFFFALQHIRQGRMKGGAAPTAA